MPNERKKVDVKIRANVVIVDPDPVHLKEGRDEAVWRCDDGDLDIDFNNVGPFNRNSFNAPKGGSSGSDVPRRGTVRPAPYKYTVKITTTTQTFSEDPGVIVE